MRINMHQKVIDKNLDEGFKEFITSCKVKNLSERTIEYYSDCFKEFKIYFSSKQLCDINSTIFDGYILWLKDKGSLKDITINTRIKGMRAIMYYFMRQNYLDEFSIRLIKAEKTIKETYTENELNILLKKPNISTCLFSEYRNWVIINYLLSTGNRLNSIINIKIKDIRFDSGYILIQKTKNKKQQMIPLSKTSEKLLMEYLNYRKGDGEDYLFCNARGFKLTPDALKHSIADYNTKRGIAKTSIHLFRHTFAKMWILAGGDMFRLQKILGHSTLDIVKEYVNMFADDLKRDFDKFSPLEQLNTSNDHLKMKK